MPSVIRIDQSQQLPLSTVVGEKISYRYAYDRSADSIRAGQPGQDYIAIQANENCLAFALCDGVSQSFYGDLAARILGEKLVTWLWEQGAGLSAERSALILTISQFLNRLTEYGSSQVAHFAFPGGLSPMLQVVLEKKRELGSETTFTAGFIDLTGGRILLCWMGDSRLRVWDQKGEMTAELLGMETFRTRERWSTHRGPVGELHTAVLSTADVVRLVTYSDGLARLDRRLTRGSPSDRTLSKIFEESKLLPSSDDISFLEILLRARPAGKVISPKSPAQLQVENLPEQKKLFISWRPIKSAGQYEVALQSPRGWQILAADQPHLEKEYTSIPWPSGVVAVRAWKDEEVSDWSKAVEFHVPATRPSFPMQEIPALPGESPPVEPVPAPTETIRPAASRPLWRRMRPPFQYLLASVLFLMLVGMFFFVFQLVAPPQPPVTLTPTLTPVLPLPTMGGIEGVDAPLETVTPTPAASGFPTRTDVQAVVTATASTPAWYPHSGLFPSASLVVETP